MDRKIFFRRFVGDSPLKNSLKGNRQDDCQYLHDEVLYIAA